MEITVVRAFGFVACFGPFDTLVTKGEQSMQLGDLIVIRQVLHLVAECVAAPMLPPATAVIQQTLPIRFLRRSLDFLRGDKILKSLMCQRVTRPRIAKQV